MVNCRTNKETSRKGGFFVSVPEAHAEYNAGGSVAFMF